MLKHVQNVMLTKIDEVIAKHFLICQYKVPVLFQKALNYDDPFYLKQARCSLICLVYDKLVRKKTH